MGMRKLFGLKRDQVVMSVVVLLAAVAIAAISNYWVSMARHGELGEKDGYSALQRVEFENRVDVDKTTPIIKRNVSSFGYDVLGLPTFDKKFPRTWIILNKTAPSGKVMRLPLDLSFHVDCAYVAALPTKGNVDPPVLSFLMGGCER
jgi:hypothetical protein